MQRNHQRADHWSDRSDCSRSLSATKPNSIDASHALTRQQRRAPHFRTAASDAVQRPKYSFVRLRRCSSLSRPALLRFHRPIQRGSQHPVESICEINMQWVCHSSMEFPHPPAQCFFSNEFSEKVMFQHARGGAVYHCLHQTTDRVRTCRGRSSIGDDQTKCIPQRTQRISSCGDGCIHVTDVFPGSLAWRA